MTNIATFDTTVNPHVSSPPTELNILVAANENASRIIFTASGIKHAGFISVEHLVEYLLSIKLVTTVLASNVVVADFNLVIAAGLCDPDMAIFLTPMGNLVEFETWGNA